MNRFAPIRPKMIEACLASIKQLSQLPGVLRIAMIGSLVTPKEDPKDIDLLVTVTDDCDLARLAFASRRLQGRMQSISHGADIFLANPAGEYIGRTCQWKICKPGIRVRCMAAHCGLRPHLYDDFSVLTLSKSIIAAPPLDLWPEIVIRCAPLPEDLRTGLIEPLQQMKGDK